MQYSRSDILLYRPVDIHPLSVPKGVNLDKIPTEILRNSNEDYKNSRRTKKRRRGKRGGKLVKLRRRNRHPVLPCIFLSNVQRLSNKTEELRARSEIQRDYRDCHAFIYSETWLDASRPDSLVEPPGFSIYREDRNREVTGKTQGGGVCILVNNQWCSDTKVLSSSCSPDLESITVKCRPLLPA